LYRQSHNMKYSKNRTFVQVLGESR
jgi:hypothetical protein